MRCTRSFLFSLNLLHKLFARVLNCFLFLLVFSFAFNYLKAADASVIVASVEGEVFSLSLEDEFQVTLDKSSVGKKIEEKSILTTGENGSTSLLFSNGTLITVKPGSRFYLRKFAQKAFSTDHNLKPSTLEEEPSKSELLAHLDFGNLIVKVPKLAKGSSMIVSSPLGTAGIRGTMFQLVAVRNPVTGDITGGVNLISGDISFTDVGGNELTLVSGQSLQLASGKLGESMATVPGGLVNLTATYGESLTGGVTPPSIDMLFPDISSASNNEPSTSSSSTATSLSVDTDWEMVHEIASEIFFAIESSESSSSNFSFDDISDAVVVATPKEDVQALTPPVSVAGGVAETLNPFVGAHPEIELIGADYLKIEMTPTVYSTIDPWINGEDFTGADISSLATLSNPPDLGIPGIYNLDYQVKDFRGLASRINRTVEVIATPPSISLTFGVDGGNINNQTINFLVNKRNSNYPLPDHGTFKLLQSNDSIYPHVKATAYDGTDITFHIETSNADSVNSSVLGEETPVSISVNDFSVRGINFPSGQPVSKTLNVTVRIIDNQKPMISFREGETLEVPYRVQGVLGQSFSDPGITLIDNYYTQSEIEQFMNYSNGADESAFGFVDMSTAGIYELTYQGIRDPSGNDATSKTRYVEVYDDIPPELILYGSNPLFVDINNSTLYKDPGVFATDNLEESIEWGSGRFVVTLEKLIDDESQEYQEIQSTTMEQIIAEAKTQDSLYATFRMKYSLSDLSGNESHIYREIVLLNSPFKTPRLVLHGSDPYYHEVNTEFIDPGVTAYKDMGIGVEPLNLSDLVTSIAYKNNVIGLLDQSKVNYHFKNEKYVDGSGNEDPNNQIFIKYVIVDEFGNEASLKREIRVVDRTPPSIVLLEGDQGVNYTSLQGGISFKDPGATVRDNYDLNVPLISSIVDSSTGVEIQPSELLNYGFVNLGDYEVQYSSVDSNDNNITTNRKIKVVDTIAPQVAVLSTDFLKGTSSLVTTNPTDLGDKPIVDSSNQIPSEIISSLENLTGWVGSEFNSEYVITLDSPNDFYVLTDPSRIKIVGHPKPEVLVKDEIGRTKARFSAFYMEDNETGEIIFEDPGVYVRNDTTTGFSFTPSLTPVFSDAHNDQIVQYNVNYVIRQDTGETMYLNKARSIFIIDRDKPFISISPDTSSNLIIIEANRQGDSLDRYTDLSGNLVKVFNPSDSSITSGQKLFLTAFDAYNGTISDRIFRKIMNSSGEVLGQLYSNADPLSVGTNVAKSIDATILDQEYKIEYIVRDIPIEPSLPTNESDPVVRRLIVKDTKPPVLNVSDSNSTFLVHYQSKVLPDVMDEQSVKDFMLTGIIPSDANNFDQDFSFSAKTQSGDNKWTVSFDPAYQPGVIFPEDRYEGDGYEVSITLKDQSGNESNKLIRYLKVGDYEPPTLYLIGQSEIHDFLRFATNPTLPNERSFADQPNSKETNSSGIGAGEHRMLLADYNFVDPGVYAEDENAYFDIKDNYPDLNGNGIGEGHAIVRVDNRFDMDTCARGPGLIHIYSWFEKNSYNLKDWQEKMEGGTYGYSTALLTNGGIETGADATGSPSKIPDVKGTDNGGGHQYTDLNKSDLTNFDMTVINIEYRVKDGWDNRSAIATRRIYIYESRQYDGYAFYATPLSDASGAPFEDYYNNGTGNPFLTSARKDTDGDGVSDFWEYALGTNFKDSSDTPDLTDPTVFQTLSELSVSVLSSRLSKMNGANELNTVYGLRDFNATQGL
jgi:hypothetical protein